jgi:hypothetical protein
MSDFISKIGGHPEAPNILGCRFSHSDRLSKHGVATRDLSETDAFEDDFLEQMRVWLMQHHANPEKLERWKKRCEVFERMGYELPPSPFPLDSNTRKGNWAEVFLAEYIASSCGADLPVYRLRYNPNPDQSMKGDDILAFDLDSDPVRVIIGEAKYRSTPAKQSVTDMVSSLEKSCALGLPISLQFVADRLFEEGNAAIAVKVEQCAELFALGKLRRDHIGFLAGNDKSATRVNEHASSSFRRIAVLSLSLKDGSELIKSSYRDL